MRLCVKNIEKKDNEQREAVSEDCVAPSKLMDKITYYDLYSYNTELKWIEVKIIFKE